MTHLSIEQLLATREPGLEPGVRGWREHVDGCDHCRTELDRLDQRVARLKALPSLRPSRDLFGAVRARAAAERRTRRIRRSAIVGIALAAAAAFAAVGVNQYQTRLQNRQLVNVDSELAEMMSRSSQLERALSRFDQDRQVIDGRTVAVTSSLEDQVARVDRQIEAMGLMDPRTRETQIIKLWRERVGLLDALVDVHITGARLVGF